MKGKIFLGLVIIFVLAGCFQSNQNLVDTDLDTVYTRKLKDYDFDKGSFGVKKSSFFLLDTITYYNEKGDTLNIPGDSTEYISESTAAKLVEAVRKNMIDYGWEEVKSDTAKLDDEQFESLVLMKLTLSKVEHVGGVGYYYPYPYYSYWGGGIGISPYYYYDSWTTYYYKYNTGYMLVSMIEPLKTPPKEIEKNVGKLVWESYLEGYVSKTIALKSILDAVDISFEQSEYLDRK